MRLQIVEQQLTPAVFCRMREKVGFQPYPREDVEAALEKTLYTVEARREGQTVGIAGLWGTAASCFSSRMWRWIPPARGQGSAVC